MLDWLIKDIIVAFLNWVASFFVKQVKQAADKAADEKKNDDIEKGVENAQTEKEAQDALNQAAGRLGRNP